MEIQVNSFGTVHEVGMPVSSTSSTRMSTKGIKQGPRISLFEIRVYAKKIAEGEMSEAQVAQNTNRTPDTVRKWSQASTVAHQNAVCDELLEKGKVYNQGHPKRRIGWGTGVRSFLPTLWFAITSSSAGSTTCLSANSAAKRISAKRPSTQPLSWCLLL